MNELLPLPVDPCADAIGDPVATPIRDASLDAQRGACLRDELAAAVTTHALIDSDDFHGLVGGDLSLSGRLAFGRLEIGGRVRVIDYAYVQTAVTKATAARVGPVGVSLVYGGRLGETAAVAAVLTGELPFTRDGDTVHSGGELAVVVTGALADRWLLHARLGAVAAIASSAGGTTHRFGLRAGADVTRRVRRSVALLAGLETQAGWHGGLDALVVRAGVHLRPRGAWRGVVGIGAPLGGNEATTAILELGIKRDL